MYAEELSGMTRSVTRPIRASDGVQLPLKIPTVNMILIWVLIFSFAFDVKGAVGGTTVQYAMAGLNIASFLLLCCTRTFVFPTRGYAALVLYTWIVFLLVGSVTAFISGVPLGHYIRVIFPFMLFAEGFWVARWASGHQRELNTLFTAMYFTAIASVVYTFWWGFHFTGDSLATIRYQIVSPLTVFLFMASVYDLVFAKKHRVAALVLLCAVVAALMLSVTRTYALVIFGIALVFAVAVVHNAMRNSRGLPKPVVSLLVFVGVAACVISAYLLTATDVAARWESRAFGAHNAVTLWTRVATVTDEWGQLISHPASVLSGLGFGHGFVYSSVYASRLLPYVDPTLFVKPSWYAAEFMWMVPIFYAGFILGSLVVLVLLIGALRAFDALCSLLRNHAWRLPGARPFWIGAVVYIAFLFDGLAGDPFVFRSGGLYFGLCLGIVVGYGRLSKSQVAGRRAYE